MKYFWRTVCVVMALLITVGCVPYSKSVTARYGVKARVTTAEGEIPLSFAKANVSIDGSLLSQKTGRIGNIKVTPQKKRYWTWTMTGPIHVAATSASIRLEVEGYCLFETNILVQLSETNANDSENRRGYISLGSIDLKPNFQVWSGKDYFRYDAQLHSLQRRADLLLKTGDWETIAVVKSAIKGHFSTNEFPIADLGRRLAQEMVQPASLAVVIIPPERFYLVGKAGPTIGDTLREIEQLLQGLGVRKIIFQSSWHGLLVEINPTTGEN